MRPKFVPHDQRFGSIASLHEELGEMVARLPAEALPRDRPNFGCSFRDIPPARYPDMGIVERLEEWAADARLEIGEERWVELQKEWTE
jgi:hypothetical protein